MRYFKRKCTVYCILNIHTGHRYVGATVSFSSRRRHHLSDLRLQKHRSTRLQEAYNQYGEDALTFFPLEELYAESETHLYSREQFWIDKYSPEYNMNPVAGKYFNETARSEKARQMHREKITGRKQSQEEKDKRAKSIREFWARPENKGKKVVSQEQRKVLSEKNTGENNPNWGRHRSHETKEKSRDSLSKCVYVFLSPDGYEFYVRRGLVQCESEGLQLPYWAARRMYQGKLEEYHGWRFLRVEPKLPLP